MKKLKILVKFPTRQRPLKFLDVLTRYVNTCVDKDNIEFLVSHDADDFTMTDHVINKAKSLHKNVKTVRGVSIGKIHACNRDMEQAGEWDILVLASDDMIPVKMGWDNIIRAGMSNHFKDTDGVLYFPDGYTALNTMCIMGKKYYDRFGYIYHSGYISLWCDNEFMEVAQHLNRQAKFNEVLFKHEHPANNRGAGNDSLYVLNDKYYMVDKNLYTKRKAVNFYL